MIPVTPAVISETAVHVHTTAVDVDTMVCNPDLLTRVDISEIAVHGSDTPVKSADVVHGSDMTVKSAVETAAVETAMPSASVPSVRVGSGWQRTTAPSSAAAMPTMELAFLEVAL